jgi:hypothetical protein
MCCASGDEGPQGATGAPGAAGGPPGGSTVGNVLLVCMHFLIVPVEA